MSNPALVYQQIAARLEPLGGFFVGDPPDAANIPYSFVWGPGVIRRDPSLGGLQVVDRQVHVTVVHTTPNNALLMAGEAENLLAGFVPEVEGWLFSPLRISGSEAVQTPHSIIETDTNRSPAWVVLHLRLRGQKVG